MRLLPWGRVLPVYANGEPRRRIGWVPASRVTAPRTIRFRVGNRRTNLMTGAVTAAGTLVTAVVWLDDGGERWLAVLDGHSSVDVWRKVPGFLNEEGR